MKKIIGILGVVLVAFVLFFNSSEISNSDKNLASLIVLNTANAEDGNGSGCRYTGFYGDRCIKNGFQVANCVNNTVTQNCTWG